MQPAARGAATVREELDAATPLRRPEATSPGSARLRTIKTAQRRLALAGITVATMLVAPQPAVRLVLGWLLLALVWATVPSLVRSRQLAVELSPAPPGRNRVAGCGGRRRCVGACSTRQEELCDLDRVERGALAQVVTRHEQAETVGHGVVPA